MIFTVTLTPALDKTVYIPGFSIGKVNRVQSQLLDAGGKGINVSKVLQALGAASLATGILGGDTGRFIRSQLTQLFVPHDFVLTDTETRTNIKIVDPDNQTHTDINEAGAPAAPELLNAVLEKLKGAVSPGDRVVLAGKAPAGAPDTLFAEWITELIPLGVEVYLDADEALLIHGAAAYPAMIKPNREELQRMTGLPLLTVPDVIAAAKALNDGGLRTVVVSLGGDGAIFVRDGVALRGHGLSVAVRSTVGAGDAMMAAFVDADERRLPFEEACRRAIAISAATVMTNGTRPPVMSDIQRLLPLVAIEKV